MRNYLVNWEASGFFPIRYLTNYKPLFVTTNNMEQKWVTIIICDKKKL